MAFDPPPHRPPDDPDELDAGLVALLAQAWPAGWMPGDVLAVAAHIGRPSTERLAAALIQREHREQRYGDRLAPRWQRQLTAVRELAPDPDATIGARRRGWRDDRLDLWTMLTFRPQLRRLGPLPGEADPTAAHPTTADQSARSSSRGAADPDVLRKVRALLAKAESSRFDAEAEAFTAKAHALKAAHTQAQTQPDDAPPRPTDPPHTNRLRVDRPSLI